MKRTGDYNSAEHGAEETLRAVDEKERAEIVECGEVAVECKVVHPRACVSRHMFHAHWKTQGAYALLRI